APEPAFGQLSVIAYRLNLVVLEQVIDHLWPDAIAGTFLGFDPFGDEVMRRAGERAFRPKIGTVPDLQGFNRQPQRRTFDLLVEQEHRVTRPVAVENAHVFPPPPAVAIHDGWSTVTISGATKSVTISSCGSRFI